MTKKIIVLTAVSALSMSAFADGFTGGSSGTASSKAAQDLSNNLAEGSTGSSGKSMVFSQGALEFLRLDSASAKNSVQSTGEASQGSVAGSNNASISVSNPIIGVVELSENKLVDGIDSTGKWVSGVVKDSYGSVVGSIAVSGEKLKELGVEISKAPGQSYNSSAALLVASYQGSVILVEKSSEASNAENFLTLEGSRILLTSPSASYQASEAKMAAELKDRGL